MDTDHANPTPADPRRYSIVRLWLSLAAMAALCQAAAIADDDHPAVAVRRKAPLPPVQIFKPAATVAQARFQYASAIKLLDAGKMRELFDTCVQQKIVIVDQLCGLTDSQKQKLQLAGRGDIIRGVGRAVEIERQFNLSATKSLRSTNFARKHFTFGGALSSLPMTTRCL